jgi:hypothetical protein
MKKSFLIFGIIAVLLLIGGGVFMVSRNQVNKNNSKVLSESTTSTEDLPVLEIFSDEVDIKKPNDADFSKAENNEKLPVGTIIKTNEKGRAQVLYPTNSVTRIDFNSQMIIEKFNKTPNITKVKVNKGRIWSRVAKLLGKDDSSTTETDTLVASVRGSSYGLGILADGSNKISVSKSKVHVDCVNNDIQSIDVLVNKKIITKCKSAIGEVNWDNTDFSDEWFTFNLNEDKKLNARFGSETYNDEPSPTPTSKPTIKPTAKPSPTPSPKSTNTPSPSGTPTPIPSPTPNISITSVSLNCSNATRSNRCVGDYSTEINISGTGFNQTLNPSVYLVDTTPPSNGPSQYNANSLSFDGSTYVNAKFITSFTGTFEVHFVQNNQDVKYSQTISIP